jgi:hypothetical protein
MAFANQNAAKTSKIKMASDLHPDQTLQKLSTEIHPFTNISGKDHFAEIASAP